jgi:hypothetical protein
MRKPFHLQIPTPCHENWADMESRDQGRHCASCQKTVVDFTLMSDGQVIDFLSNAGPDICGRLAPDQLDRNFLTLPPPQRNRLSWWNLLLTGLLFTQDGPRDQHGAAPPAQKQGMATSNTGRSSIIVGAWYLPHLPFEYVNDTLKPVPPIVKEIKEPGFLMGVVARHWPDSLRRKSDSVRQKTDSAAQEADTDAIAIADSQPDSLIHRRTLGIVSVIKVDTIEDLLADTPTITSYTPGPAHKKNLKIYPNPVRRGSNIYLAWNAEAGTYQVGLFSATGALIGEKVFQVGATTQKDSWVLPIGMAAGNYFLRALRQGAREGFTARLVVE